MPSKYAASAARALIREYTNISFVGACTYGVIINRIDSRGMILCMHTVDQESRVRPILGVPLVRRDKCMAAVVVDECTRGCEASTPSVSTTHRSIKRPSLLAK